MAAHNFEDLSPKSQAKVLKRDPDFHTLSDDQKSTIVALQKHRDKAAAGMAAKRYKDSGAQAVEAIAKAQKVVAAKGGSIVAPIQTPVTKKPVEVKTGTSGFQKGKKIPTGAMAVLHQDNFVPNLFALDEDNPLAKNAVNYNPMHADMMSQVGRRLEQHRIEREGEDALDTTELGDHITHGFEALNAHDDAAMGGDLAGAKKHIRLAGEHFKKAHEVLEQTYGPVPKVTLGGLEEGSEAAARAAKPIGDWAKSIAEAYIRENRGNKSPVSKGVSRKFSARRIINTVAQISAENSAEVKPDENPKEPAVPTPPRTALDEAKLRRSKAEGAVKSGATTVKLPPSPESLIASSLNRRRVAVARSVGRGAGSTALDAGLPGVSSAFTGATLEGRPSRPYVPGANPFDPTRPQLPVSDAMRPVSPKPEKPDMPYKPTDEERATERITKRVSRNKALQDARANISQQLEIHSDLEHPESMDPQLEQHESNTSEDNVARYLRENLGF